MSSLLPNPEKWYADYQIASPLQQYNMVQSVLELTLSEEFIKETDLVGIILGVQDELINHNQLTETIALIEKFQKYQPELYAQEYFYFDKFKVQYYLYTGDFQMVKASLVRFRENPETGIDQMMQVLDLLKFYNATEIATNLCRATYKQVEISKEVIGGTEIELAQVILLNLMDSAYQSIKQGETVDWNHYLAELEEYDYKLNEDWINQLQQDLKQNIEVNEQFFQEFKHKQSQDKILRSLSVEFFRYMLDETHMSFICSQAIWGNIMSFLIEHRKLKKKQLAHPDSLFGFSQNQLDSFLAQQIGNLFSFRQGLGFATLWGIPYLYDFLSAKQIINPEIHQRAIKSVSTLKKQLITGFSELWQFDFVHRWLPPDSISETDWEAEVKLFTVSEENIKPLSNEPSSERSELFNSNLTGFFGKKEQFELNDEIPTDHNKLTKTEPATSSSLKMPKPPKKKKSPLIEAAKLFPAKPKKSTKKGKKRNF